jgi:hypothetical protein
MQPIDVVILCHERPRYLEATLESLRENTRHPFSVIAVDNAGRDPAVSRILERFQGMGVVRKAVRLESNIGMRGWYYGIREVVSPLFALSDPDVLFPGGRPCWLTRLVDILEKHPDIFRAALSLDGTNLPPCWNRREGRRLCFRTGPRFRENDDLKLVHAITTPQLIRKKIFDAIVFEEGTPIELAFWKRFRKHGFSVAVQSLRAVHLGWNEYFEEPEYLLAKRKMLGEYREASLIDGGANPAK